MSSQEKVAASPTLCKEEVAIAPKLHHAHSTDDLDPQDSTERRATYAKKPPLVIFPIDIANLLPIFKKEKEEGIPHSPSGSPGSPGAENMDEKCTVGVVSTVTTTTSSPSSQTPEKVSTGSNSEEGGEHKDEGNGNVSMSTTQNNNIPISTIVSAFSTPNNKTSVAVSDEEEEKLYSASIVSQLSGKGIFSLMDAAANGLLGGEVMSTHDYFVNAETRKKVLLLLSSGKCAFSFSCKNGKKLNALERALTDGIVNLSAFADEVGENYVPLVDPYDPVDMKQYAVVVQKCAYVLPGMQLHQLTPLLLCDVQFQKNAQPSTSFVWEDGTEPYTFRLTKTIITWIYSLTVQFHCSKIDPKHMPFFSQLMGIPIDQGILMERTKRNKNKASTPDATAKAKSVLLYTKIDGGVLVHNYTIALNTSLPNFIASIVDSFGSSGMEEVAETAANTRRYLRNHFALQ